MMEDRGVLRHASHSIATHRREAALESLGTLETKLFFVLRAIGDAKDEGTIVARKRSRSKQVLRIVVEFYHLFCLLLAPAFGWPASGALGQLRWLDATEVVMRVAAGSRAPLFATFFSLAVLAVLACVSLLVTLVHQPQMSNVRRWNLMARALRVLHSLLASWLLVPVLQLLLAPAVCDDVLAHHLGKADVGGIPCGAADVVTLSVFGWIGVALLVPFLLLTSCLLFDADPQSKSPNALVSGRFQLCHRMFIMALVVLWRLQHGSQDAAGPLFAMIAATFLCAWVAGLLPFYRLRANQARCALYAIAAVWSAGSVAAVRFEHDALPAAIPATCGAATLALGALAFWAPALTYKHLLRKALTFDFATFVRQRAHYRPQIFMSSGAATLVEAADPPKSYDTRARRQLRARLLQALSHKLPGGATLAAAALDDEDAPPDSPTSSALPALPAAPAVELPVSFASGASVAPAGDQLEGAEDKAPAPAQVPVTAATEAGDHAATETVTTAAPASAAVVATDAHAAAVAAEPVAGAAAAMQLAGTAATDAVPSSAHTPSQGAASDAGLHLLTDLGDDVPSTLVISPAPRPVPPCWLSAHYEVMARILLQRRPRQLDRALMVMDASVSELTRSGALHVLFAAVLRRFVLTSAGADLAHACAGELLERVPACEPLPDVRFALYCEVLALKGLRAQADRQEDDATAMQDVDVKKMLNKAVSQHRKAVRQIKSLWYLLFRDGAKVDENVASKLLQDIAAARDAAQSAYQAVLQRNSRSVQAVRMFATFLRDVRNLPEAAQGLFRTAAELEDANAPMKEGGDGHSMGGASGTLSRPSMGASSDLSLAQANWRRRYEPQSKEISAVNSLARGIKLGLLLVALLCLASFAELQVEVSSMRKQHESVRRAAQLRGMAVQAPYEARTLQLAVLSGRDDVLAQTRLLIQENIPYFLRVHHWLRFQGVDFPELEVVKRPDFIPLMWFMPGTAVRFRNTTMSAWDAGNFLQSVMDYLAEASEEELRDAPNNPQWRFVMDNSPTALRSAFQLQWELYVRYSEESTAQTLLVQILMFCANVAVLLALGLCVFRPAVKKVMRTKLRVGDIVRSVPRKSLKQLYEQYRQLERTTDLNPDDGDLRGDTRAAGDGDGDGDAVPDTALATDDAAGAAEASAQEAKETRADKATAGSSPVRVGGRRRVVIMNSSDTEAEEGGKQEASELAVKHSTSQRAADHDDLALVPVRKIRDPRMAALRAVRLRLSRNLRRVHAEGETGDANAAGLDAEAAELGPDSRTKSTRFVRSMQRFGVTEAGVREKYKQQADAELEVPGGGAAASTARTGAVSIEKTLFRRVAGVLLLIAALQALSFSLTTELVKDSLSYAATVSYAGYREALVARLAFLQRELMVNDNEAVERHELLRDVEFVLEELDMVHSYVRQGNESLNLAPTDRLQGTQNVAMYARGCLMPPGEDTLSLSTCMTQERGYFAPSQLQHRGDDRVWYGLHNMMTHFLFSARLLYAQQQDVPTSTNVTLNWDSLMGNTHMQFLHDMHHGPLRDGFALDVATHERRAASFAGSMSDNGIILLSVNLVVVTVLYFFVFRGMVRALADESQRAQGLLLLVPCTIVEGSRRLRGYYVKTNASDGS